MSGAISRRGEKSDFWTLTQRAACGGKTWMCKKLVEYAMMLVIGAVYRRLGYLLELFESAENGQLELLRKKLTATYMLLNPMLPTEGKFIARWRLRLNVSPEEIEATIRS